MTIGSFQLQTAVYSALSGDNTLTSTLGATVVDDVPHGTSYPFVSIGEARSSDYSTKNEVGGESLINIHI